MSAYQIIFGAIVVVLLAVMVIFITVTTSKKKKEFSMEEFLNYVCEDGLNDTIAAFKQFAKSDLIEECIKFAPTYETFFENCSSAMIEYIYDLFKNGGLGNKIPEELMQFVSTDAILKFIDIPVLKDALDSVLHDAYVDIINKIADEGEAEEKAAVEMAKSHPDIDDTFVPENLGLTKESDRLVNIGGDIAKAIPEGDMIEVLEEY